MSSFNDLLKIGQNDLKQFEMIRKRWYDNFNINPDISKVVKVDGCCDKKDCSWCTKGKRSNFTDEDKGCSNWCLFCMNCDKFLKYQTGLEPTLYGIYFDQIYSLNKYVYTVTSTNSPNDKNEMFIYFYLPKSKAISLCKYFKDKEYYYYTCYDRKYNLIDYKCDIPIINIDKDTKIIFKPQSICINNIEYQWPYTDLFLLINKQHCSNINFEKTMIWEIPKEFDLYENDDPIVYIELNDYLVDRRNLYEVLLNYLEMIYK